MSEYLTSGSLENPLTGLSSFTNEELLAELERRRLQDSENPQESIVTPAEETDPLKRRAEQTYGHLSDEDLANNWIRFMGKDDPEESEGYSPEYDAEMIKLMKVEFSRRGLSTPLF